MPTKKAVKPKPAPQKRRAPKQVPPITDGEMLFAQLVMKGTGNPSATNLQRIEHAAGPAGMTREEGRRAFERKPVQAYMTKYREQMLALTIREDMRVLKRKKYTKDDVLDILHDLATMDPDRTKGTITGQVAAAQEMSRVLNLVAQVRNPDELFKDRSVEELDTFAKYGTFTKPVTQ